MSGRIIEQGMPAIGARVIARRVDDSSNTKPTYEAETDDLGEYRIGGLPAGQYTRHRAQRASERTHHAGVCDRSRGRPGDRLASSAVFPGNDSTRPARFERVVDVRAGQETGEVDFDARSASSDRPGNNPGVREAHWQNDPGAITGTSRHAVRTARRRCASGDLGQQADAHGASPMRTAGSTPVVSKTASTRSRSASPAI